MPQIPSALTDALKAQILSGAAEIEVLRKTKNPDFLRRYETLAFPGGYSTAVQRIKAGESDAIEAALCFVEIRPRFFRSGYIYNAFLPKLKSAALDSSQQERLRLVLERYVQWKASKRKV